MCGRARCTLNPQQVARACGFPHSPTLRTISTDRFRPTYNASPGCYMPVAMLRGPVGASTEVAEEPVVHCMKWGLVPSFTGKHDKPDHFRMFNARSESVKEKASFRRLVPKNRCLVAVEGFYEWKKDGSKKQPYYIHFKDQRPLVFASLYDSWVNSEGEVLYTFTILTTSTSSSLQWLHDRMPVVLGDTSSSNEWLTSPVSKLDSLLHPYEGSDLVWYPVTPAMGKTSFDGPECIKELKPSDSKPISNFFVKKSGSIKPDYSSEAQESLTPFKSTSSEIMKHEPLFEGIDEPPVRTKQDDDAEEADLVRAMKEEPCDEDIPEPTVDSTLEGIESKVEILGTEHAKDFKYGEECGRYKGPVRDSEHGGSRSEVEAHGVKREVAEIEPVLAPTTKKRGRCVKTAGEGQSTLLSFFGKK